MKKEIQKNDNGNEIPSFDGVEFSGKNPKSRETLYRMMKMLNIPDFKWESIATKMLKEDQERVKTGNDLDSDDEDVEEPLTESELDELIKRGRSLHFDLVNKGQHQNVPELLDILGVLLEAGEISQADYMKATNKIKGYL